MKRKLEKIRFGVEIEVEFPKEKDSWDLIQRNKVIAGWSMDYDGSLNNGAEYKPKDKNYLYYNDESMTQIKEIIALVKVHKGNIRPTCGLHIHVDMKQFNNKEIINIVKAFIRKQDDIIKKFKVLKFRLSEQQKIHKNIIKKLNVNTIRNIKKGKNLTEDFFNDRYYLLNIQSLYEHKTLEFRLFNGTIQPSKIKRYIKWALEFCIRNSK